MPVIDNTRMANMRACDVGLSGIVALIPGIGMPLNCKRLKFRH
ncbi:hypothetical protein [Bifidobacterium sp.]